MDRYTYGAPLVLPPTPPSNPDDDVATDGSEEGVGSALRAAWDAVSLRWHDSDLAYSLADLSTAVDVDGVVRPDIVRREMQRVARANRWLVNTSPAYDLTVQPVGSSGGNVSAGRRRAAPVWNPTDVALAQHRARPAHDTGGGRLPADYVSPR